VFHGVSFPLRFFPWVIIRWLPPGKDTPPFLSNTTFSYNSLISDGLKVLVERTREISRGNLTEKIKIKSDDEIGILARSFNDMVQQLSEREDSLRKSEEQQRTLISNIPGAVYRCAYDNDWTMQHVSDFIEEISGYPFSDFIDNRVRTYASIIHPDDSQMIRKIILNAIKRKEPYEIVYRILHPDGTIRWVYEKGQGEFGINDELLWLDGAIFDVSDRKKMEEELERLATIDGLTDVANRRNFDITLNKEWMRLARTKKPLSMIMCDIDFFKIYNDTYGHQSGDNVLKQVSKVLKNISKRSMDLAARYGGEEFAIILPETDDKNAMFLANRLLAEVESLGIEHKGSDVAKVITMSVGVATIIPDQKSSPDRLIAYADSALYDAKRTGRNKVGFIKLIIDYIN